MRLAGHDAFSRVDQLHAGRTERRRGGAKQADVSMSQQQFAISQCSRAGQRAKLDAVGQDRVHGACQRRPTLDGQDVRAEAGNPGTHRDQAVRQVSDLRFACGVADGRGARCGDGGQQEVLRGAD